MRLLILEIKRVMKTRLTWILLLFALFLSAFLAYIPITFASVSYQDEQGNKVTLNGLEAVGYVKQAQKNITGVITPHMAREAVEAYQACLRENHVTDSYELPEEVYAEKILPVAPILSSVREAYADPATGMVPSLMEITPQQAEDFYTALPGSLDALMRREQKEYPAAQKNAAELYSKVEMPFVFSPGCSSDAIEYQSILIFLITIFCVVIAAPVFASDYQTEADHIHRCTKYGRSRLGITKMISALGICILSFGLCLLIYILTSNSLFGWEGTKTSIQMMASVSSLLPLNQGQLQGFVAAASAVSFLAVVSATLFISSKCKNTVSALSISLVVLLAPIIVSFSLSGPIELLIRGALPSGGIGLMNSHLYAMLDFKFVNIGQFSLWMPYAMLAMAAIEIPLFIGLTLFSYTKHRIK